MFRLVFLTFHGERSPSPSATAQQAHSPSATAQQAHSPAAPAQHGAHDDAHDAHSPAASAQHGGHGHLHDAPPAMAFALIVLAIGSVLAGYVGVPAAIGGGNRIEHYLHPSFVAHGMSHEAAAPAEHAATAEAAVAPSGAETMAGGPVHEAEAAAEISPVQRGEPPVGEGIERSLMLVSSVIALTGIGLAWFFFVQRPSLADAVARSAAPLHRLLLNKYYVDELYDSAVVQPVKGLSERVLWRVVDADIIDGAVNGAGSFVSGASSVLRRWQSGSVRGYAVSLFFGVVAILAYYLWRVVTVVAQRGV
jgi:NADH-quinone oxidoreductase subunit L